MNASSAVRECQNTTGIFEYLLRVEAGAQAADGSAVAKEALAEAQRVAVLEQLLLFHIYATVLIAAGGTASDNCATDLTITSSTISDGMTCPETLTRTYFITDDCDNTTEVEQIITVDDTTDPMATPPQSGTQTCTGPAPPKLNST